MARAAGKGPGSWRLGIAMQERGSTGGRGISYESVSAALAAQMVDLLEGGLGDIRIIKLYFHILTRPFVIIEYRPTLAFSF
jgi:hypothetical protein